MLVSATQSHCPEWVSLIGDYRCAAVEYGEAVIALSSTPLAEFTRVWQLSERARKRCEALRDTVLAHEYEHGCSIVVLTQAEARATPAFH